MKIIYEIDYDFKTAVRIEIDERIMTEAKLKEINEFWSDGEGRVNETEDGTVLHAVLKLLAAQVLRFEICGNYPLSGINDAFDWDNKRGVEGWPKMDGSAGIKIVSVDEFEFETTDMSISIA